MIDDIMVMVSMMLLKKKYVFSSMTNTISVRMKPARTTIYDMESDYHHIKFRDGYVDISFNTGKTIMASEEVVKAWLSADDPGIERARDEPAPVTDPADPGGRDFLELLVRGHEGLLVEVRGALTASSGRV